MTRWFRFYEESINDPKLLRLPDDLYRAWTILLCFASRNEGILPPAEDIAVALRIKSAKVAEWITKLIRGGLIDNVDGRYQPHNWNGRQYKSDVSTERVKRFRNGKRNVSETASETAPEQRQTTEQSRADARTDLQKRAGEFQQAIVQAYEAANSTTLPDTSRASLWISQGYDPEICLAVIAEKVRRRPSATLSYFDEPIAEAHAKKAPPRKQVGPPPPPDWDAICVNFLKFGQWSKHAPGNEPGLSGCQCPPDILEKHGIVVAPHEPIEAPKLRAIQ